VRDVTNLVVRGRRPDGRTVLDRVATRVAQETQGVADVRGTLDRARRHALAVAAADVVVSFALERDW